MSPNNDGFGVHHVAGDGAHHVAVYNLRVLISRDGDSWIAEGVDIDYAADGASPDEARARFERGLAKSVKAHLAKFGNLRKLVQPAPDDTRKRFENAVPPDEVQHSHTTVMAVPMPAEIKQSLPRFGDIIYATAA